MWTRVVPRGAWRPRVASIASIAGVAWMASCSSPSAMPDAPDDALAQPATLPAHLADTGLYSDFATKSVAASVRSFAPRVALWSDAAVKTRWISLPAGATIDSDDFDRWTFPVGTKLFKEFALDGKRLETRVIWRVADTGDRERDTLFGAYLWNDDETDAVFAEAGGEDLRSTMHDAPSAATCWKCHIGEPGRALGFTAVQLPSLDGLPLSKSGSSPGAPNEALGYLHANCGHCHNPEGSAWTSSSMVLRLGAAESTAITATTIGVDLQSWTNHGFAKRIVAGDPDSSAIVARMSARTVNVQMPPIATEIVDPDGVAVVRAWIEAL